MNSGESPPPVWYVVKDDNIIAVIQLSSADTWGYRVEAAKYPDCYVWNFNHLGWCKMFTTYIRSAIWRPSVPPDIVLMAKLLEI